MIWISIAIQSSPILGPELRHDALDAFVSLEMKLRSS